MSFAFGTQVRVRAELLPVYATVAEQREPTYAGSMISKGTGVHAVNPESYSVHGDLVAAGEGGGWPGEAVPETDVRSGSDPNDPGLEPVGEQSSHKRGNHRRLRRFAFTEAAEGVVVGRTHRQEGRLYGRRFWDPEDGPPQLVIRRVVPVLQVALDTGGCARVVVAWRDDVEAV